MDTIGVSCDIVVPELGTIIMPKFLHITDVHISATGVPYTRDDAKVTVPGIDPGTREDVLHELFARVEEYAVRSNIKLDGVIFTGDAQERGAPGGHERVLQLIVSHLERFGITPARIVATPGNHDVPRDSEPSSADRYDAFIKVWRDAGCVVPWLDGIDPSPLRSGSDRHRLVASDSSWAVYPLNTSNWSNVASVLPPPLSDVWRAIPDKMAPMDAARADKIRNQLQSLARYDMARVSAKQLEAFRTTINETPRPKEGRPLRIVAMHHHLRSPSLSEELKPFADLSNLEQVRATLSDGEVNVVLHGHKHEQASYYDHVYRGDSEEAHRMLVVSGATFAPGQEQQAMRLITVDGLPHVPKLVIEPLPLPRAGTAWRPGPATRKRLWVHMATHEDPVTITRSAPVVVVGSNIDEVYARACAAAEDDVRRGMLVVHLDLPLGSNDLPLPCNYPLPTAPTDKGQESWLRDLVKWWQLERSQLEHRVPYVHGSRLRRYGGKINQISRIIDLLREKDTTRAVAVLVDPFRDFLPDGGKEEFASFCLVEFRRRDTGDGVIFIDAVAFYRAQEFAQWWPINVAELRVLQLEIGEALGANPGRITTIAADARRIARSPTQVAMPLMDRWLDQAPERLHLLADAFSHRVARSEEQWRAVLEWRHALEEIRKATQDYNADGVPIAIEGLRTLATYLESTAHAGDADAITIAIKLRGLADHNEGYDRGSRSLEEFRRWSRQAKTLVNELDTLTSSRVNSPSSGLDGTA